MLGKRFSIVLAALAAAAPLAHADAFAAGYSDVTTALYAPGTGADISDSLWAFANNSFYVFGHGPGTGFGAYGGGLIDGGVDGGSGPSWFLFGQNVIGAGGFESTDSGYSDAGLVSGMPNFATEDTYNELVYKITNHSAHHTENFSLNVADGVVAEVSLDNSQNEYGLDEAILNFGYTNSLGDFTGNVTSNTAYAFTGMSYGTDTYDYVANTINLYYSGFLRPGQSIYFAVQTENFSQVYAQTPGPAAIAPFALGLIGVLRRRKKA